MKNYTQWTSEDTAALIIVICVVLLIQMQYIKLT